MKVFTDVSLRRNQGRNRKFKLYKKTMPIDPQSSCQIFMKRPYYYT